MRPFRPRGQSNAMMWNQPAPRDGFFQQPGEFWGENDSNEFYEGWTNFSASPSRPRGFAPRARGTQRGGGGPSRLSVVAGRPRFQPVLPKSRSDVERHLARESALPKVPAVVPPGPATLHTLATRIEAIEKHVEVLLGINGLICELQSDVQQMRDEVIADRSSVQPAKVNIMPVEEPIQHPVMKSCIVTRNDAMFTPTSDTEGLLIVVGNPPMPITVDDYYTTEGLLSFAGMTSHKVYCEIANVAFSDEPSKDYVLMVTPAEGFIDFFRAMKSSGVEGILDIQNPQTAVIKCVGHEELMYEVKPGDFYFDKQPLFSFENIASKTSVKFFPDLEAFSKEGKRVCKAAWNSDEFPFDRPVEDGSLVEMLAADAGQAKCKILTGKYKGCIAGLEAGEPGNFAEFDILRCEVQISETSELHAVKPELVPTKKNVGAGQN